MFALCAYVRFMRVCWLNARQPVPFSSASCTTADSRRPEGKLTAPLWPPAQVSLLCLANPSHSTCSPHHADSCPPEGSQSAPALPDGAARVHVQAALRFPDTVSAAGLLAGDFVLRLGPTHDPEPGPSPASGAAMAAAGGLAPSAAPTAAACACGEDPDAAPMRPPLSGACTRKACALPFVLARKHAPIT